MVTTFYLNILILRTVCDVLYECMLNSTAKLRINQLLSYLILLSSRIITPSVGQVDWKPPFVGRMLLVSPTQEHRHSSGKL